MGTFLARYLPHFSEVTAPLRELLTKENEFRWEDDKHGKAFRQLKEMLVAAPVLGYYDVSNQLLFKQTQVALGWARPFYKMGNRSNMRRVL